MTSPLTGKNVVSTQLIGIGRQFLWKRAFSLLVLLTVADSCPPTIPFLYVPCHSLTHAGMHGIYEGSCPRHDTSDCKDVKGIAQTFFYIAFALKRHERLISYPL